MVTIAEVLLSQAVATWWQRSEREPVQRLEREPPGLRIGWVRMAVLSSWFG
jgi:hypothetical protein